MTASEDAVTHIDLLMHAQGHAHEAFDTAQRAVDELGEAPAGLATLATAVAELANAVAGIIDVNAQRISDAHGLTYGEGRTNVDPS